MDLFNHHVGFHYGQFRIRPQDTKFAPAVYVTTSSQTTWKHLLQAFDDYGDGGTDITIKSGGSVLFTADGGDYEDFIQAAFSL